MTMENKLIDTGYLKSQITNENQPTKLQKLWEDYLNKTLNQALKNYKECGILTDDDNIQTKSLWKLKRAKLPRKLKKKMKKEQKMCWQVVYKMPYIEIAIQK